MILGSITYRGNEILDFSPRFIIGSNDHHGVFDSLDNAKQWIDEFLQSLGGN